jgi:predicted Zn-dependent protease
MSNIENTVVEAVRTMTNKELVIAVLALQEQVASLIAASTPKATSSKEMTDADAERLIIGDLAATKHKDAASLLGLTYGQVYSCRLEFTFKNVHKAIKDAGKTNPWMKK